MPITEAGSKAIYLEELEAEFVTIDDPAIADRFASVFAKAVNRILLETVVVNAGTFSSPPTGGQITGVGEIA